ncbi:hypothetical protein [Calycomorphotria hydatis]|uniref:Uncharacterized protein n=1 Tax=Calycomorphotria hydatis TaxID=2528027 RepID=A0A517TBM5_9PLAN|nr:hypothetical protein [Calycomorphotria hydatis]QDT65775.1 hypothetical protein V22_30360 [Calycomorphotria hydatis]
MATWSAAFDLVVLNLLVNNFSTIMKLMAYKPKLKVVATLSIVVFLIGCSEDPFPRFYVNGEVQVDGEPLPSGRISFLPDLEAGNDGPHSVGYIQDGAYKIVQKVGPIAGPHLVTIIVEEILYDGEEEVGSKVLATYETVATIDPDAGPEYSFDLSKDDRVKSPR